MDQDTLATRQAARPPLYAEAFASDATFERAWRAVRSDLERRARHLAKGNRIAADELIANTALKTLLYMRRMPTRIRNPEGFMFVVLNHVFLDSVRHADREGRVLYYSADFDADHLSEIATTALAPAHVVELSERLFAIAAAVERLPTEQKQLFALKFEQDLPYSAIASQLQISEALARKRVELLRRKLRTVAEPCCPRPRMNSRSTG